MQQYCFKTCQMPRNQIENNYMLIPAFYIVTRERITDFGALTDEYQTTEYQQNVSPINLMSVIYASEKSVIFQIYFSFFQIRKPGCKSQHHSQKKRVIPAERRMIADTLRVHYHPLQKPPREAEEYGFKE
jgi:hypothetical protein